MSLVELLQSTQDLARCRFLVFDITQDMTPWWWWWWCWMCFV